MLNIGDCSGRIRISDASVIGLPAFPAIAQQTKHCCAIASRRHYERNSKKNLGYKSADVGANRKEPNGGTLPLASIQLVFKNGTNFYTRIYDPANHSLVLHQ